MTERERRAHIATFGCRVNQAESDQLAVDLGARGLLACSSHHDADVVVIQSCTVTHRSEADLRKLVRRVRRENPSARIVVSGCAVQRDPDAWASLGDVAAVVANSHRNGLADVVDRVSKLSANASTVEMPAVFYRPNRETDEPFDEPLVPAASSVGARARPLIKVQDGCDARCTYCIIPSVRGQAQSAAVLDVVRVFDALLDQGAFEVVVTGVHLGTYGQKFSPPTSLFGLVTTLITRRPHCRVRLSAIEPMAFDMALADLAAQDARLAPHFHLPAQSGSDRVLKRMNRGYRSPELAAGFREIRARVPNVCLGTDLIVGFPGETDDDFEETLAFVNDADVNYLHVFSYSDRPGAPATRLRSKVPAKKSKARAQELIALGDRLWQQYLDRQVGLRLSAIVLGGGDSTEGRVEALSENYCPLWIERNCLSVKQGDNVRVRITGRREDRLVGEVQERD